MAEISAQGWLWRYQVLGIALIITLGIIGVSLAALAVWLIPMGNGAEAIEAAWALAEALQEVRV